MKYKFEITETLQKTVEIEAETFREAKAKMFFMYEKEEVVLTADDFTDVSIVPATATIEHRVIINDKEYIARFKGISKYIEAYDYIKNLNMIDSCNYLFKNFLIKPRNVSINDFDTMEDAKKVYKICILAMQGTVWSDNNVSYKS